MAMIETFFWTQIAIKFFIDFIKLALGLPRPIIDHNQFDIVQNLEQTNRTIDSNFCIIANSTEVKLGDSDRGQLTKYL